MGSSKAKNSRKMDKRTSKPDIIHEDEMKKHKSTGVKGDKEI
ncbi:hypothetical protein OW763_10680 [Clostridium aestuarii]|uniref:Uncharacterized protein n=1 Tax=Clostridium aestuarii TaxID=338193 RepID=A0ABT4D3G2_9CLOT|nr:hypothetical protein [Clostridium aestuarii]MCY6484805.1 hypothetical protein [Clostridium aestuarii]